MEIGVNAAESVAAADYIPGITETPFHTFSQQLKHDGITTRYGPHE